MLIANTLKLMKSETKIAITKAGIGSAFGSVAAVARAMGVPLADL
jgi:hypothetical protein